MSSIEYWEGRNLERNTVLKEAVAKIFNFDSVDSDGRTNTKGDLIGINGNTLTHVSVKYASGGNTQVHLPTLRSLAEQLAIPASVYEKLDKFFGTNDLTQWANWTKDMTPNAMEAKYRRIRSDHIEGWNEVEQWFNANRRKIAVLLLQSLKNEDKAAWLIWANKKKGGFQAIDVNKFVDWIVDKCTWVTMPSGTVLRCAIPSPVEGKIGKPIFFVQMKNSGGPVNGYNHCPQFHLHNNWPKEFVVYEDNTIKFN